MAEIEFTDKQVHLATMYERPELFHYVVGATQSGKTVSGLDAIFQWSGRQYNGQTLFFCAKNDKLLKENVLNKVDQWSYETDIPIKHDKSNRKTLVATMKDGPPNEFLWLLAVDGDERSSASIQGLSLAGGYIDELCNLTKPFLDMLMSRLSAFPMARIVATMNPKGPHFWVKKQIIDPILRGQMPDCAHYSFQLSDNRALRDNPDQMRRIASRFHGPFKRRMVYAEWAAAIGLVYPLPEDAIVTKVPDDELIEAYDVAIDYGKSTVTCALLIACGQDADYVIDEWGWDGREQGQLTDKALAAKLTEWALGDGDRSIRWWFVPADARPFAERIYEFVEELPIAAFRKNHEGMQFANMKLEGIKDDEYGDTVPIRILASCENLLQDLGSLEFKEKPAEEEGEDKIDKSTAQGAHWADAFRYGAASPIAYNTPYNYEEEWEMGNG